MEMDPNAAGSWDIALSGHYTRVCSLALLLWDYLLTLEDERTMFWEKPRNLSTYVFFWNRYINVAITIFGTVVLTAQNTNNEVIVRNPALTYLLSDNHYRSRHVTIRCSDWFKTEAWMTVSSFFSVQVILQLRIYALYGQSRKVAIAMLTAFALEITAVIVMLSIGSIEISAMLEVADKTLSRCRILYLPSWILYFAVVILIFEAGLSFLAMFKTYERFRDTGTISFSPDNLVDLLLRDSNFYYLGILTIYTINITFWSINLPRYLDLVTGFALVIPSILANRIMLNVRIVYYGSLMLSGVTPSDFTLRFPEYDSSGYEGVELVLRRHK